MTEPIAILAIADTSFRERVGKTLRNLRWQVLEAAGGAEALAQLEAGASTAVIVDTWLPDLAFDEFVREVEITYPDVEMISTDGSFIRNARSRVGRRGELLYALRVSQEWDGAAYNAPAHTQAGQMLDRIVTGRPSIARQPVKNEAVAIANGRDAEAPAAPTDDGGPERRPQPGSLECLPEFFGSHPSLLEVSRRIRLVAPRTTTVLVQGPSGSGKELVARSLHRLSSRAHRPLVALNCAAIPESLLEAELFGHTRGAFTGAVQGRSGRIEAANGGTLFLDEIGEMPLALQAKLLRFLEAGELQRVGDNDIVRVDVRVVAASHQNLAKRVGEGLFRLDLFFRLAVFLIETPALETHIEDTAGLAQLFLRKLSANSPAKSITEAALQKLGQHRWPGNVRELAHVMERAYILAEDRREITAAEIEFSTLT